VGQPVEFSGGDLFFCAAAHSLEFVDLLAVFKSPEDFLVTGEKLGGRNGKF
jgi:hypothetical protein